MQVRDLRLATLLKKRLWYRCLHVNFAKFIRTPFSIECIRWLFLFFTHEDSFFSFNLKLFFFFMTYSRWLDDLCPTWYIGNFVQEWKGLISTYFSLIFLFFILAKHWGSHFWDDCYLVLEKILPIYRCPFYKDRPMGFWLKNIHITKHEVIH